MCSFLSGTYCKGSNLQEHNPRDFTTWKVSTQTHNAREDIQFYQNGKGGVRKGSCRDLLGQCLLQGVKAGASMVLQGAKAGASMVCNRNTMQKVFVSFQVYVLEARSIHVLTPPSPSPWSLWGALHPCSDPPPLLHPHGPCRALSIHIWILYFL